MHRNEFWFIVFIFLMIILYFYTLKLNFILTIRFSQIVILILFTVILFYDIKLRIVNVPLLLFLFGWGLLLSLISLNSINPKIYEYKFIIKYLTTFPASFYIGYRIIQFLNVKQLIKALELTIFIHCSLAIILYYYPIFPLSILLHNRGSLTGYQGTFWESTGFGAMIGLLIIIVLALRYEFKIFPKNFTSYSFFIGFSLISIIASKSKTFWFAFIGILIYLIFIKPIFYFMKYKAVDKFRFFYFPKEKIPLIFRLRINFLLFATLFTIIGFFIINSSLPEPIVTQEMIQEKLESERGKALKVSLELLEKTNWLGGYGWGFVELFFSTHNIRIQGLGAGVGMIFNSYLNEWLSVGILGLIFHIILLILAFSNKYLFTALLPLYLLIYANVHPVIGEESYYLFLGLSYGFKSLQKGTL